MPEITNLRYQNDMEFGFKQEEIVKPIIEEKFGELNRLPKYNPFDYENENYLIELKSRNINHNTYPTAMLNYSKILKTATVDKIRYIVFNYTDGIFVWRVNSDEYEIGRGGRCDRGCDEYSTMIFVKKEYLTRLEDFDVTEGCCA